MLFSFRTFSFSCYWHVSIISIYHIFSTCQILFFISGYNVPSFLWNRLDEITKQQENLTIERKNKKHDRSVSPCSAKSWSFSAAPPGLVDRLTYCSGGWTRLWSAVTSWMLWPECSLLRQGPRPAANDTDGSTDDHVFFVFFILGVDFSRKCAKIKTITK